MATDLLGAQPSPVLCDLFFDCDEPDERDALFEVLSQRQDDISLRFLASVMEHDEDPYLRVAAARALGSHQAEPAWGCLHQLLHEANDEVLFEEAMAALLALDGPRIYQDLLALSQDNGRDTLERRLALVGMEQAQPEQALAFLRHKLAEPVTWHTWPHDLLAHGVAALVRGAAAQDQQILSELAVLLPQQSWPDPDDAQALYDLVAEGQALLAAQWSDEAAEPSALAP